EAAGITKYKARRRQTQLKLEAAQQNLLRVNDIVHEVEKQLESLKRQASKARRYRAVRDEMQAVERVLYGRRFLDLPAQSDALPARLAAERGREEAAALALAAEEAQMEARRTALYEDEARLEEVRARLGELTLAVDRHQGRSGYCREQIAETDARAAQARAEAEELRARVGPLADHVDERRSDEARLRIEKAAAEDEARTAEAAQAESAARQAGAEAEQEAGRNAQVDLMARLAALGNARESVRGNAARASADLLKLAAETEELEKDRVRVGALHASARERAAEAEALRAELLTAREQAAARGTSARTEADAAGHEAEGHQSERDGLAGRRASLEEMVATHSAFDEGVRALLAGPEGIEVLGVVADAVETDSRYERAV